MSLMQNEILRYTTDSGRRRFVVKNSGIKLPNRYLNPLQFKFNQLNKIQKKRFSSDILCYELEQHYQNIAQVLKDCKIILVK